MPEETGKTNGNQNPYLFIVGCPRSGTTLLKRMCDAHPRLAIPPESHWIPGWFEKRRGLTPEGFVTADLIEELLAYPKFSRLGFSREELGALINSDQRVSYSRFVAGIFNLYGKAQGKPLVGDKTPGYARRIRTLHTLWPRAKFVHLIRDGRDVCLSYINWEKFNKRASLFATWPEDPVSTAALWWECHVRLARDAGNTLGPDLYYEMRYESLVADSETECRALCEFLNMPYHNAMLRFHEGRTRTKPGLSAKRAWLPITPGLRDWKIQMSGDDVERFEAVAGNLLDELNYPRAVRSPEPEAMKHASRIRNRFAKAVSSRTDYSVSDRRLILSTVDRTEQNPVVFIVGCARSGTTLLQRVVDAHREIAVVPEIHWITNHFKKVGGLSTDAFATPEIVSSIVEHKRFPQLEICREDFLSLSESDEPLPCSQFLTRIFEFYGRAKGKGLVGNKTPAYVRSIQTLHALYPQAKFVHLIRDGRDVCLSILNWKKADHNVGHHSTWDEDRVSTVALWWKRNVQLGQEAGKKLGPELYAEIRYESLVATPAAECRALCRFLEVPYDDAMIRFHEGGAKTGPHFRGKRAQLPITKGLRDWREQMSAEELERFEAAAGDLLDELGYARAFPEPSPEILKRASLMHDLFTEGVRARGRLLPEVW